MTDGYPLTDSGSTTKPVVLVAASGWLLSMAWPPMNLAVAGLFAFVPFVIELGNARTARKAFFLSGTFGLVWSSLIFDWIRTCGAMGRTFGPLWPGWIGAILGTTVTVATSGYLLWWLVGTQRVPVMFALPASWMLVEEILDFFAWHGCGTSADCCRLALTQVSIPVILQSAALGGVLAVGWLVLTVNALAITYVKYYLYRTFRTSRSQYRGICWGPQVG